MKKMVSPTTMILSIIGAVFASTGFWVFVTYLLQRHDNKKDKTSKQITLQSQMLLGLGHDRIIYLGSKYLDKGFITKEEYEGLNKYLFVPYQNLGGNGTAEKIMREVEQLPMKQQEG